MSARARAALVVAVPLLAAVTVSAVARMSPRAPRELGTSLDGSDRALAERLYRDGVLPSGAPLRALGAAGELGGADAACARCHRRSGMGMAEGDRIIPPVAGRFLFQPRADAAGQLDGRHTRGPDLAHALGRRYERPPYGERSLLRAIRDGIDASGRRLEPLMPRYRLDDREARLLVGYLRGLAAAPPDGVTPDTIHFATVVLPDVDAAARKAQLDVVSTFFDVRNSGRTLDRLRERPYAGSRATSYRAWQLHVWELTGAPETWEAQLDAFARRQPVFALVSGLATGTWAPVQRFCERRAIPCWFPTVDLPAPANDFYSVYFFGGVRLEADILGRALHDEPAERVIQIRTDDAAAAGAAQALGEHDLVSQERVLPQVDGATLARALSDATEADALVLWLRARDLAALRDVPPPRATVYLSATLAGGEHAPLPPSWKAVARLVYPFELPERRRPQMTRVRAWLATHGLPLVDERAQADAYLACVLLAEKVDEMRDDLQRDYLLERAEGIVGMRTTAAMYRRLSLGPGQRFASKGGYLARFAVADSGSLVAASDWIVP